MERTPLLLALLPCPYKQAMEAWLPMRYKQVARNLATHHTTLEQRVLWVYELLALQHAQALYTHYTHIKPVLPCIEIFLQKFGDSMVMAPEITVGEGGGVVAVCPPFR